MLKWKLVRLVILCLAVALSLSSIFVYMNFLRPMPNKAENTILFPLNYYMPIPGQEVSLDQAQASMPFKVQLPTNMGTPMQIKVLLPPQTDMPSVTIIYAAVKLPSNASIPDVLDQNGIGLGEMPIGMTLQEAAQTIRDAIDSTKNDVGGLQPVTINGYLGCEGGNIMHTVSWCTETTSYVLAANINYPLQQLVEIAQSIPIK